jgi:hypothetical protein
MIMANVRILADTSLDGIEYKPNQVVDIPGALVKSLKQSGVADDAREAVAYCTSELGVKVIKHGAEPDADAAQAAAQ